METYANELCLAPNQSALIMPIIPIHDQLELVGYVQRAFNVESGASRGHVADDATVSPAIARADGGDLQGTGSEFVALFVHRMT